MKVVWGQGAAPAPSPVVWHLPAPGCHTHEDFSKQPVTLTPLFSLMILLQLHLQKPCYQSSQCSARAMGQPDVAIRGPR